MMNCDPPIDRVDAAAFAGRSLAGDLHRSLEASGVGCTRLAIHAVTANGEELERVWRCAEPLTEDATADRVRWQLDGWLNKRNPNDRPTARRSPRSGCGRWRWFRPKRCSCRCGVASAKRTGCGPAGRWCGYRACSGPRRCRCRCSAGDGGLPSASPSPRWAMSWCRGQIRISRGRVSFPNRRRRVLLDDPVELFDAEGNPVRVTGRGLFSADPSRLAAPGTGRPAVAGGPARGRSTNGGGIPSSQGRSDCTRAGAGRSASDRRPCCCATGSGGGISKGSTNRSTVWRTRRPGR